MARTTRDTLKDRRNAILHAIDRIDEHLYSMVAATGGEHAMVNEISETGAQMTEVYRGVMTELLSKI